MTTHTLRAESLPLAEETARMVDDTSKPVLKTFHSVLKYYYNLVSEELDLYVKAFQSYHWVKDGHLPVLSHLYARFPWRGKVEMASRCCRVCSSQGQRKTDSNGDPLRDGHLQLAALFFRFLLVPFLHEEASILWLETGRELVTNITSFGELVTNLFRPPEGT